MATRRARSSFPRSPLSIRLGFSAVVLSMAALPAAAQSQQWVKQFGWPSADFAVTLAPDAAGGVFVGGGLGGPATETTDGWLARYDLAGNQVWFRQIGAGGLDRVTEVAADSSGGVFVSGVTEGNLGAPNAGNLDVWLARYDALGNQSWLLQLGTSEHDLAAAVASDGLGGVYVCGSSTGPFGGAPSGLEDAWVARFDAAGSLSWMRQFGGPDNEEATELATDGAGGVYVCGLTEGSFGGPGLGGWDAWVARYDSTGNQLWLRKFGSNTSDYLRSTAPDGSGGLFLTGSTSGTLGSAGYGGDDGWLARFDGAGTQLWTIQFGTPGADFASAAAPDGSGGVILGGSSTQSLFGASSGLFDAWVSRFDDEGNLTWSHQTGSSSTDDAQAVLRTASGGLYVTGGTSGNWAANNAGNTDVWLARYEGSCGVGPAHCSPSVSSIAGCQAGLSASGSPNVSWPQGFALLSGAIPGGNLGICLFGANGPASIPFGTLGGVLCVQPPFFRTPPKGSGGDVGQCNGSYAFSLSDLIAASSIVSAGSTIHAQMWARDPANADGFLLSDGIEFTVCP